MTPALAAVLIITVAVLLIRGEPGGAIVLALLALPLVLLAIRRERRSSH